MTRNPRKSFPHHVSLYLDSERYRKLRALAKATRSDASKLLRAALDLYFQEHNAGRRRQAEPNDHALRTGEQLGHTDRALRTGERLPILVLWTD